MRCSISCRSKQRLADAGVGALALLDDLLCTFGFASSSPDVDVARIDRIDSPIVRNAYLPVYDSDGDTINGSDDEVESNAGNGDELDDEEDVEHSDDEESDPERDDPETDNEAWLRPEDGEERVDGDSDKELGL
ncbi:hypothetical protein BT96DRAFT_990129 [Gymnopus androsaceus JB14]|uniref:Uncharacterized protein n=1 Tax=Gymnopus androsaceus JB14 TaxID=1447944 RepID=A0A6A4HZS0_9AGAR|nr:hypothetical protein BT96DRAFT_990129 [Gymnopus androsaceus JB14]